MKPNPNCANCNHPWTFHRKKPRKKNRKCNAFGCGCEDFIEVSTTEKSSKRG